MGILRGGLLAFVVTILFLSLLTTSLFLTFSWSLNYENVKEELVPVVKDLINEKINLDNLIENNLEAFKIHCQSYPDYVFNDESYTFVIPCEYVLESTDFLVSKSIENFIETSYYKDYSCSFWKCVTEENPLVLVSLTAKNYWKTKFFLVLGFSLVLCFLVFLLLENRHNVVFVLGILLILASLPFMKFSAWSLFFQSEYMQLFSIFFTKSYLVFLISLISGLVLIIFGIIFKIVNWDSLKKKFSKEDVKEIVKKEISKPKKN